MTSDAKGEIHLRRFHLIYPQTAREYPLSPPQTPQHGRLPSSGLAVSDACSLCISTCKDNSILCNTNYRQDPTDRLSYLCAWLALVPQGLCVVYATLIWSSREAEVLLMFAGQMGCEAFNWVLKRYIKEERPKRMSRHHNYLIG